MTATPADRPTKPLPPQSASHWDRLPDYAALLTARHEAHGDTFRRMVADLPLRPDEAVLDVAIGDGFFADLLSRRVTGGRVVGVDIEPAFLDLADDAYVDRRRSQLVAADTYNLPFDDGTFDLVWCTHSLRSLPDALGAVREWSRMLRPGGRVAVLENDRLHAAVFPWAPDVELAVYHAECAAELEKSDAGGCGRSPGGLHAGRRVLGLFAEAGLRPAGHRTYATDVAAPLPDVQREFLAAYFRSLVTRVRPHLDRDDWHRVSEWVTPDGTHYLPDAPDLQCTFLDIVAVGDKP